VVGSEIWLVGWVVMQMHCSKLAEGIGVPLDYDKQWAGMVVSKIFELVHHF